MSADRFNDGKPQMSFLLEAPTALENATKVLEFGAIKYSRGNWKKGLQVTSTVDSMMRHLVAYMNGENDDPESKLPHTAHILVNAMFLAEIDGNEHYASFDDRDIGP